MSSVTIIVTTCDRPLFLDECLASLPDCRVIVVDDSAQPHHRDINRGIAERRGAEYLRAVGHVGTSYARMAGLGHVDSEYFAFFDDDDVMLPEWLPLHLSAMADADVVGSAHFETDRFLLNRHLRSLSVPTLDALLACRVTISDNALIRAAIVPKGAWHPEREHVMMLSLWLALAASGARFAMIGEPTWLYRIHGGNQTLAGRTEADARWRRLAVSEWAP